MTGYAKRLVNQGWAVLLYRFSDQIIVASDDDVVESFKYIQAAVAEEITNLQDEYNYQTTHLVGISLGNVAMMMVAKKFHNFSAATLVTAGDDLAEDLWHGIMTQNIRRLFEFYILELVKLDEDWKNIAPIGYVSGF